MHFCTVARENRNQLASISAHLEGFSNQRAHVCGRAVVPNTKREHSFLSRIKQTKVRIQILVWKLRLTSLYFCASPTKPSNPVCLSFLCFGIFLLLIKSICILFAGQKSARRCEIKSDF